VTGSTVFFVVFEGIRTVIPSPPAFGRVALRENVNSSS
jgi:hypothetical protein